MKRLLVTGASGLLGFNLSLRNSAHCDVTGIVHSRKLSGIPFTVIMTDLTNPDAINKLLDAVQPESMIHCAAMADIDTCEKQPEQAELINNRLPGDLAKACKNRGIRLVHISTDAVFDGNHGNYLETDMPNPLSVYAQTKLRGEQAVLGAFPDAVVARVNFYGWSLTGTRSLAEFFYNNLKAGKLVKGFTDVEFCPLFVNHLSDLLMNLLEGEFNGIYHVVSPVSISKYEFGCSIADIFGLNAELIQPVLVQDGGLIARRSLKLTLNTDKLKEALQIALPGLREGIHAFAEQQAAGYPQQIHQYLAQL